MIAKFYFEMKVLKENYYLLLFKQFIAHLEWWEEQFCLIPKLTRMNQTKKHLRHKMTQGLTYCKIQPTNLKPYNCVKKLLLLNRSST